MTLPCRRNWCVRSAPRASPTTLARSTTCTQSYVKGYVSMVNSIYNGFRFEDVWLDR